MGTTSRFLSGKTFNSPAIKNLKCSNCHPLASKNVHTSQIFPFPAEKEATHFIIKWGDTFSKLRRKKSKNYTQPNWRNSHSQGRKRIWKVRSSEFLLLKFIPIIWSSNVLRRTQRRSAVWWTAKKKKSMSDFIFMVNNIFQFKQSCYDDALSVSSELKLKWKSYWHKENYTLLQQCKQFSAKGRGRMQKFTILITNFVRSIYAFEGHRNENIPVGRNSHGISITIEIASILLLL